MGVRRGTEKLRKTANSFRCIPVYSAICLGVAIGPQAAMAYPRSDLGITGMIEMPSARMAPDGELSAGASFFIDNQHYNLGFQALPWLETDFHYSGLQRFDPNFRVYYDRSFGFKARLWDETDLAPAVAVGVDDLVGTGFFGGEYLVASKQFGNVDTTLGIGWGRLGTANTFRNPFSLISSSFDNRPVSNPTAGQFSFDEFFHGRNAGVFGGLTWQTPIDNLSLIAEYSSDGYTLEKARGNFSPRSQLNLGLSYNAFDSTTLGLSWLYGRAVAASFSFHVDPVADPYPVRLAPPLPPVVIRTAEEQQNAIDRLREARNLRARPDYSADDKSAG